MLPFSLSKLLVVEFLHFNRADFALDLAFAADIKLGLGHIEWQLLLVHETVDAMVLILTVSLERLQALLVIVCDLLCYRVKQ